MPKLAAVHGKTSQQTPDHPNYQRTPQRVTPPGSPFLFDLVTLPFDGLTTPQCVSPFPPGAITHPIFFFSIPMTPVTIYDTTLRDGTQGTGISFSTLDKIRVAEKLDDFGVHYIEGGWPGSNPKDAAFF